jgi:hypothetical protein
MKIILVYIFGVQFVKKHWEYFEFIIQTPIVSSLIFASFTVMLFIIFFELSERYFEKIHFLGQKYRRLRKHLYSIVFAASTLFFLAMIPKTHDDDFIGGLSHQEMIPKSPMPQVSPPRADYPDMSKFINPSTRNDNQKITPHVPEPVGKNNFKTPFLDKFRREMEKLPPPANRDTWSDDDIQQLRLDLGKPDTIQP